MKKIKLLTLISITIFGSNLVNAQSFYTRITAGYGFPHNGLTDANEKGIGSTFTIEQQNISVGKGFNGGIALGYMFNEYIGAELSANYLLGTKTQLTYEDDNDKLTLDIYGRMLRVSPAIVIQAGEEGINPYVRFGATIGLANKMIFEAEENYNTQQEKTTTEYTGNISTGVNAAAGVNFTIGYNISLFAEANLYSMSYAPEKSEKTKYTFNGEDHLTDLSTREKETQFGDSYTEDNSSNNPDEPRKAIKFNFPFSSIGANIGLRINL